MIFRMYKNTEHSAQCDEGFTLVEVMVVMVIIGLLTTFVVLNVLPSQDKAMVQKAKTDIRTLEQAAEFYRLDMNDYPAEIDHLTSLPVGAQTHKIIERVVM